MNATHYYNIYSTGYYSWRNSVRGSWFIQALCDVLERHAGGQHPLDLLSMMTRVCRRVAYEFESNVDNPTMSRKKQVRPRACTLTSHCYSYNRVTFLLWFGVTQMT